MLTGGASQSYRIFEPTPAGRLALLQLVGRLIRQSWGWPIFVVSLAGVVAAVVTPERRRMALALVLPVLSYHFTFLNVILYSYDRFVLPIDLVLALFAGLALDRFLIAGGRWMAWRTIAVATTFAYTLLYSATVDVLMIGDSRYAVERWLTGHVARTDLVGSCFDLAYLPNFDDYHHADLCTVEEVQGAQPAFFVLNADYARAVPPAAGAGRLIAGLQAQTLGYHLVLRSRRRAPWPWLPGAHADLVGAREETSVYSVLRNINPTIEVFERDGRSAAAKLVEPRATLDGLPPSHE